MLGDQEAARFLDDLRTPKEASTRYLLERVIGPNVASDFGRRHGFEHIHDADEYRARVPIRSYEGFRADCDRIRAGEQGVLTVEPVKRFFTTSGSTSAPKYVPVTNGFIRDKSRAFGIYWSRVFADHPKVKDGRLVTNFSDAGEAKAESDGLPVSSESAYWAGVTAATQRKTPLIPKDVARIKDHEERCLAIARILLTEDFAAIMALNPSTLLLLFETMERHREALIRDVALRDPARAAALEKIDAGGAVRWPASAVFPSLELAVSWRSPMLAPYLRLLARHLGEVRGRDYLLMASEGVMAIPIEDGASGGPLAIGVSFYELIPHARYGAPDAPVLLPHEASVGEEYVIVLSNSAGLYRYDMGDVVRVRGFADETPIVEFLHRAGATSSLTGEKLTEPQVTAAVDELARTLGLELESFTLFPSDDGLPHYVLLAEARTPPPAKTWAALRDGLDAALAAHNGEYLGKRGSKRLGAPELWIVAPGSYAERANKRVAAGAADLQLKPVHLVRDSKIAAELKVVEKLR